MFGGEDCSRRPLADLFILDLSTLAWTKVDVPGKAHTKPQPRCGHAAVVCHDKLVVFGGGRPLRLAFLIFAVGKLGQGGGLARSSVPRYPNMNTTEPTTCAKRTAGGSIASCLNDSWLLDLDTLQWTKPTVAGDAPTPRAGHASVLVGERWYILGGGNNVRGERVRLQSAVAGCAGGVWSARGGRGC